MGINYTLSSSALESHKSHSPSLHFDLSTELLRRCDQSGPLYDYSHVKSLLYKVLLHCGYELQQHQNSYNAFDLLSEVGSQIHSHLQYLRQYKLTRYNTPNVYTKLKQARFTPLAFNQSNAKIRIEALTKALTRITRALNIWAYNSDSEPNSDGSPLPPSVNCLIFDNTGKIILTGSGDGIIKIWHSNTGNQVMSLPRHPGGVTSLDVHSENTFLASTCDGGECRFWEIRGSWWRLACTISSRFKFLWCKFTSIVINSSNLEDILICTSGDGSLQLHLLNDLIHSRNTPLKTVNLTNLRAYDISHKGYIPWLALGLESGDADSSDKPAKLGVATLIELDSSSWSENSKVKHQFLWDSPSPNLWSTLEDLGYLSQLNPNTPLVQVQPGQLSHKFSHTIMTEENSILINSIPKEVFSIVSSCHQESPDVCFSNLSRNLITASDDGNAFLWNMYTGDSIKLITKCMDIYESKVSKQTDNNTGPIYTITCLEWSCDDSLIYIGDSIYSRGNSRKSLSSMRTIESGFTVFDSLNGLPIGHGLHKEPSYNLSAIKANPLIPHIALVISYSGSIYLINVNSKTDPSVLKKINCGPGACWLDAAWHPGGSMFILSQKYGCFSIFSIPTFTFTASDIACTFEESISPNTKGDRFAFGFGGHITLPSNGFVPLHYSLCPDLFHSNLLLAEPSNMGDMVNQVDDLEIAQAKCDLKQFIHAHISFEQDFDNVVCCFHHLQTGNLEFVERFHDWKSCRVCFTIFQQGSQYRQQVELRRASAHDRMYSEYGDHMPCLPPAIKSQLESLRDPTSRIPRTTKTKPGILLKLLQAPTFDSDDSDDSDFTASPPPTRTRRPATYSTRLSTRVRSPSSCSSSDYDDVPRRRRRKRAVNSSATHPTNTHSTNTHSTTATNLTTQSRPKLIKFDDSSIDHLLSHSGNSTGHYCFLCACASTADDLITSSTVDIPDFMIGNINDTLIGPIVMDRQSLEAIVSNIASNGSELVIEDAKSAKHAFIYLHHYCLVTIDSITIQSNGMVGLDVALYRASETKCTLCQLYGAALHCKICNLPYHSKCSFNIYSGFRIYPNAIVGDFICISCSRDNASDYISGLCFNGLTRDWMFGGTNSQSRATRSRLRSQLAYRRVVRTCEWISPQQGDILWFEGLNMDADLTLSDRLIPLYIHYAHLSFAGLVVSITPLYSGYGVNPQLMFNIKVLILPPHPCYGITISIYSYCNDTRYIPINNLILGLVVQNMLGEDDNLLVYDSTGEWRSARVVGINSKCRRLLDFDCSGSELIKRLDRAIQAAKDGIKVKINNKRDGDPYLTLSGWQVEPTGEVLNIAGALAEQILQAEFPEKKRDSCEEILDLLYQSPFKTEFDELNSLSTQLVPRPISLQEISNALTNGLLRQITSFDELVKLAISNAYAGVKYSGESSEEEKDRKIELLNKFREFYDKKMKNKIDPAHARDLIADTLDRLEVVCKIAFYKQSR